MATNFFSPATPIGASLSNLAASLYAEDSPAKMAEREAAIEQKRQDAALKKAKIAEYHAKEEAASAARAERATAPLRVATGIFGGEPLAQSALDHIKAGPTQDPLTPNDDNGVANIPDPRLLPQGVTPENMSALLKDIRTMGIASAMPGKSKVNDFAQAQLHDQHSASSGRESRLREDVLGGIRTPEDVSSAIAAAKGMPLYREGPSGGTVDLRYGTQDQTAPLPQARAGEIKAKAGAETALGVQRGAQTAKTRAETLPQVQVPVAGGGTVPALGRDAGKAALTAANAPAGGDLTPEAIEHAAQRYAIDRTLPPNLGRGAQGAAKTSQILNRAAMIAAANGDSAGAAAISQISNKASAMALGQLTKQEQMVGAFEKNALSNADIALQSSAAVDRTGIPVLNRWIMAGQKNVLGDPDVSRFHAATTTFVNEYAKIMSGSMGNTAVSDSLRKETEALLGTKDTPEQFQATIDLMKQEMRNRMKGFAAQKSELTSGMAPRKSAAPTGPEPTATDAAGNKMVYRGGKWVPLPP